MNAYSMNTETTKKLQVAAPRILVIVALMLALVAATAKAGWSPVDGLPQTASSRSMAGGTIDAPVQAGDEFDVAIRVDGAENLAAFETTLRYDPNLVLPSAMRMGAFAPSGSSLLDGDKKVEGRHAVGSYNPTGQTASGSGDLVIVTFEVVADGKADIRLDPSTTTAFDQVGQAIPAKISLRMPGGLIYLPRLVDEAD